MSTLADRDYAQTAHVGKARSLKAHAVKLASPRADETAQAEAESSPVTSVRRMLTAVATCLLLALLLNARAAVHDSMAMADGPARTITLTIGQIALGFAEATHLTWPRDRLDAAFGHAQQPTVPPLLASGLDSTPAPISTAFVVAPAHATATPAPTNTPTPVATRHAGRHTRPTPLPTANPLIWRVMPGHHWQRPTPAVPPRRTPSGHIHRQVHHVHARQSHPTVTRQPRQSHPTVTRHLRSTGAPQRSTQPVRPPATNRTAHSTTTRRHAPAAPPHHTAPSPGLPLRAITPAHPLRLLVTGDSLPGYLGPELVDEASQVGSVNGSVDVHDGTGLTSPAFVDWSLLAQQQVATYSPDAVVVWLGGNDFQNMTLPNGAFFQAGTPAWTREYQRRAEVCMRIWARGGTRRVYWLAMPPARNRSWAYDDGQINIALQRAAAQVPGVEYLDILGPITDHGRYADYVYQNGQPVLVRESDGVHVNIAGSRIVAHEVLPVIVHDWRLGEPAPTAQPTASPLTQPAPSPTSTPRSQGQAETRPATARSTAPLIVTNTKAPDHPATTFRAGAPALYCWVRNGVLPPGASSLTFRWSRDHPYRVIDQFAVPREHGLYTGAYDTAVGRVSGTDHCTVLAGGRKIGSVGFTVTP